MDHRPRNPCDVAALVCDFQARGMAMAILGQGSKEAWGRPVDAPERILMSGVAGIISYDPEELVLTALAGTSMSEINAALAEKRQHLAFEPPDLAPLWGKPAGSGTIGGVLACNIAGPRRPYAGAARDHFLGARAVNGLGQEFKSGGKVVKNVTGYDLPKLLAGSFGTLAIMTEVTVKTVPAPAKERTALFGFHRLEEAHAFLIQIQQGDFELDGAALVPLELQSAFGIDRARDLGPFIVAGRMSGTSISVKARCESILRAAGRPGEELHTTNSAAFWSALRDVRLFHDDADCDIWRLSAPPTDGQAIVTRLKKTVPNCRWYMDWGGGSIWIAIAPANATIGETLRGSIAPGRGHATLVRGSESLRRALDPFPVEHGALELSRRVKSAFDPKGVLNPHRLHRHW